jgi:nicotinamidase/pyrazinamidase
MWPNHCVQNTKGAEFVKDLIIQPNDIVVKKGTNTKIDSYSGFFDNSKKQKTELDNILKKNNIKNIFVCGLATDYCVSYTAFDGEELGYNVSFIEDASKGIDEKSIKIAIEKMKKKNIKILNSNSIII